MTINYYKKNLSAGNNVLVNILFHQNVLMFIGQKDHIYTLFLFCFLILLYTIVYYTAFWLKLRWGWFFLEHILKQQKHKKKGNKDAKQWGRPLLLCLQVGDVVRQWLFFNAVPVSDRPIYRAGGNLPNCPYKVNGVQILDPFDFHCVNKNSFPHF